MKFFESFKAPQEEGIFNIDGEVQIWHEDDGVMHMIGWSDTKRFPQLVNEFIFFDYRFHYGNLPENLTEEQVQQTYNKQKKLFGVH